MTPATAAAERQLGICQMSGARWPRSRCTTRGGAIFLGWARRRLSSGISDPAGHWFNHVAVLKDGLVYDAYTGPSGLPIMDYLAQFEYIDGIKYTIVRS